MTISAAAPSWDDGKLIHSNGALSATRVETPISTTAHPHARHDLRRGRAARVAPRPRPHGGRSIGRVQPGLPPARARLGHPRREADILTPPANFIYSNTPTVDAHADVVRQRIREYSAFGAITRLEADHPTPFGIQPLHVILKPGRKPRLVIDLSRNLNQHLAYEYFTYSTVRDAMEQSTPNCWYSKLDLTNCFLSFPLHSSALPHFIFRFEDELYQFTRVPFGLSSAPRICTELLAVVAYAMGLDGVDALVRYLDDFLFIDGEECANHASLATALRLFDTFGLVVNPEKTEGPAQRITFLGVLFDSTTQTVACTPERVAELLTLLREAVSQRQPQVTALQTLIGKLQFATQVLPGFRPFTLRLQAVLNARLAAIEHGRGTERRHHFQRASAHVRVDSGSEPTFPSGSATFGSGTADNAGVPPSPPRPSSPRTRV